MKKLKNKKVAKLLSWEKIKSVKIKDVKQLLSFASRGWLHYAIVFLVCGLVGAGGLKLTLASFAATPTGTLDIVTYVGSPAAGNEIGSVSVVTAQGGSGVQCTPSSGTTDAGAGSNHGHVHLTCPAASGGGPRTYVFSSASRDGFSISGASPHAPGDTFHISGGQTTTLSIVMNDNTPAPAAPAPTPSNPAPASAPDGTVDIVTYDGSVAGGNEIGSVDVVVDQGGSGVQCTQTSGTTQPGAGANHGHVHLTCPAAADGGPRTYKFVSATRPNYVLNPVPHPAGDTFKVSGGATTTLSLVMDRVSSTPQPSDPGPTTTPPASTPTGTLDIITYEGSAAAGNEIGSVEVVTDQGGSGVQCTPASGTTADGAGANHGHVHLTCPAAADGGPRTYKFVSASRFNFELNPVPHPAGDTFHISGGQTTTLSIVMNRVSSLPAPTQTPNPTPNPGPTTPPPPANQKTGSAQVTTYVYHADGTKTRLGGVNLHIQSVNYDTSDTSHGCNNYNETTGSSGSNFGQVHFDDCWTGATNNGKAYQLSYTQLPAGYSFRSFHITGPSGATFTSGSTSNTDGLGEQFKINPNENTKLEVWLNQNDESQTDLSNVKQVVTQSGTRYVPADDSEAAKQAAAALNLLTGGGSTDLSDIDPDEGDFDDGFGDDGSDDFNPPSPPGGLTAVQDASGSVALTWQASSGDPEGENVTYGVQRTVKNSTDDPEDIGDFTNDLTMLDTSDNLEYPQTYIYIVTASDDNDNTSEESTVEITTTPLAPNVDVGTPADTTAATDPATPDTTDPATDPATADTTSPADATVITSPDDQSTLTIPDDAATEDLSCSVSASDSTGSDMLADIGTPVGDTSQSVCRDDSGDVVDDFGDDVDMSIEEDDSDLTDDTDLYGFDGTDWELIPTATADGTNSDSKTDSSSKGNLKYSSAKKVKGTSKTKYTVKSKHLLKLALVDRRGGSNNVATPIVSLMLLVVLGVAARIIVRRRLAENYSLASDGDPDIMAFRPDKNHPEELPDPDQIVISNEDPPDLVQPMQPVEQPRFVVHPDKPKDKK